VALNGTRLARFIESVEKATGTMGRPELREEREEEALEPAAPGPEAAPAAPRAGATGDSWAAVLDAGRNGFRGSPRLRRFPPKARPLRRNSTKVSKSTPEPAAAICASRYLIRAPSPSLPTPLALCLHPRTRGLRRRRDPVSAEVRPQGGAGCQNAKCVYNLQHVYSGPTAPIPFQPLSCGGRSW